MPAAVKPIPDGFERLVAHLVVDDANKAIEFYRKAFGAEVVAKMPAPGPAGKIMHAEIRFGNSIVMLCDDFPEWGMPARNPKALGGSPVTLHRYVENADAAIERAVKAGATVKMPAMDAFWGDRYGSVVDPFGHEWAFATHKQDLTLEQMQKAAAAMFAGGGCGSGCEGH